ncbi:TlyA family RNA methyltransferase [Methylopila turkensis]|uniref:TlyA family rRNA (Cytidine-2'-O)-methyltransferase n=1 Tax=Methylopila turkensis TaxID=1437816 RepID=A0A9W6JQ76_9HYPH|nr:TlyA family RNA methyltransferase [Methylopila turkensis]GLK79834.1 TlyA family rRNA (cytidine-2'-O)-methyltransferase [Methylopila turkensis]
MTASSPSPRRRADLLLVERGLFDSRARAQAAIAAGGVRANGVAVARASDMVPLDAEISAEPAHPWVSRAGVKLAHALDAFGLDVTGCEALDVGASTGGFTQVLLARGAAHVTAVDVGRGQLHALLVGDPRVTSLEATDIRDLAASALPRAPDVVTVDVSFAPLGVVLPPAVALAAPSAALVVLVKPQFEVGRKEIGKGGVVRNAEARARAAADARALVERLGFAILGELPSPIPGGDGNIEHLIGARRHG